VKVPLKDDPTFASVNVRELVMFTDVLPKLQVSEKNKKTFWLKKVYFGNILSKNKNQPKKLD
jgi:hypothetical protein